MEFKIGDQVKITTSMDSLLPGLFGTVRYVGSVNYGVQIPSFSGHNLGGRIKEKDGWYCLPAWLELRDKLAPESEAPTFWVFHDECWHECTNRACEGCGYCDCDSSTFHDHGVGECAGIHYAVWIEWYSQEIRCKGCYDEHD